MALLALLGVAPLFAYMSAPAAARKSGAKRVVVNEIIIHATGGPSCQHGKVVYSDPGTLKRMARFFRRSRRVSIHYIIGRDGEIAKGVSERQVAIHTRGHNRTSIGIELINEGDGLVPFPEKQTAALIKLVRDIRRRHKIPLARILRHSDADHSTFRCGGRIVRRKQDPGASFPWNAFQAALQDQGQQRKFYAVRLLAPPKLVRRPVPKPARRLR